MSQTVSLFNMSFMYVCSAEYGNGLVEAVLNIRYHDGFKGGPVLLGQTDKWDRSRFIGMVDNIHSCSGAMRSYGPSISPRFGTVDLETVVVRFYFAPMPGIGDPFHVNA